MEKGGKILAVHSSQEYRKDESMEQVQRENIPEQMQERIAAFEDEFALLSLTHDDTGEADVWVAALENSEGKARIITCTVKKNGGGLLRVQF